MIRRCPGCRTQLGNRVARCRGCEQRLPEALHTRLRDTQAAAVRASDAADRWLAEHPRVTPRELEAIGWLAQGLDTAAVATRMGIAVSTAKSMLDEVARRWEVRSRTHLVARAYQLGYLHVRMAASVTDIRPERRTA